MLTVRWGCSHPLYLESAMSRPIRFQPAPWSVFFVTARCIHSRFLLRPSPRVNSLIIGVLARAVKRFDVKLFGLCFMSNHYHLLFSSQDAASTSSFMQFILSNIAREIGRLRNWREKFWGRRYRASVVLDEAAQIERLKYILSNSVKEGLVKHPRYWPGIHCYRHLAEGARLNGIWIDRTLRYQRPDLDDHDVISHSSLKLDPLPCLEHLTQHEYRETIKTLTRDILAECDTSQKFMGAKRIMAQNPLAAPDTINRSPAPLVHCVCPVLKQEFIKAYRAFVGAYKEAYQRILKMKLNTEFPDGSLPPTAWFAPLTE